MAEKEAPVKEKPVNKRTLVNQLPFQIFLLVAGADDEIDSKEFESFFKLLKSESKWGSPHAYKLFLKTAENYDVLIKSLGKGLIKKSIEEVEQAIDALHKILPLFDVNLFKGDMYKFAESIAKSSGGFAGFGAVSVEEERVLKELKEIFTRDRSFAPDERKPPPSAKAENKEAAPKK